LRLLVRPADLVTRVGGDEFVVVLHDVTTEAAAVEVAERVVATLREPVIVDGHEVVVHGSVGVSTPTSGAHDGHAMVADADTAMYRAKQAGGSRVAVFTPPMRNARERHVRTESELREALRNGALQLCYQPIVNLRTGQFDGVEALLRWPGHDEIQDAISVAEESELITLLGEWVLTQALIDAPASFIGVNVSVRQLIRPQFADVVRRTLEAAGVEPQRLCIEVTETSLADNIDTVVEVLGELRAMGARVAIDDFGTGHASLTYLARFPVDIVKVDRSFVRGLGSDAASGVIVRSVAAMAHALGMTVIAEGVESLNQLEIVLEAGCDAAQGYLFSRPEARQRCVETLANAVPWPVGFSKRRARPTSVNTTPTIEPARRYRLLLELARDITGRLDLDEVLSSTFTALRQLLSFGGGSIQLVDASGDFVRLAAADPAPSPDALAASIPVGKGIGGRIVTSGEPRYIPDILDDPDVPKSRNTSAGVRSYFGVPLITEGSVIGVLQIDSPEIDPFSEEDRFTVLAFTPIVAAAIQNARLFEREAANALMPTQRAAMDDANVRREPTP
ncbi:MAG TPA: EAL domain-containing protein, partial [Mycobacteriales bacterium]|nr:EAL domain-containing protein [Mycobacteriales bacterium]